jgi:hypothetical protein
MMTAFVLILVNTLMIGPFLLPAVDSELLVSLHGVEEKKTQRNLPRENNTGNVT